MTICNVIHDADGGCSIYADSDSRDSAGGPSGDRQKCFPLPLHQAAVTGRGELPLMVGVWGFLWNCNLAFDQAVDVLVEAGIQAVVEQLRAQVEAEGAALSDHQHVAVVGWSAEEVRYRVHLLRQEGGAAWRHDEYEDGLLMPWEGAQPALESPGDVVRAAERQAAILRADDARNAAGGSLWRTRLLPEGDGIEISRVHDFRAPPSADPIGAAMRACGLIGLSEAG